MIKMCFHLSCLLGAEGMCLVRGVQGVVNEQREEGGLCQPVGFTNAQGAGQAGCVFQTPGRPNEHS